MNGCVEGEPLGGIDFSSILRRRLLTLRTPAFVVESDADTVMARLKDLLRPVARKIGLAAPAGAWDDLGHSPWEIPRTSGRPRACNICHWTGDEFIDPSHCEMATCPRCGSIARDRFLLLSFLSRTPQRSGMRVLETSPRLGAPYRRMMRRHFDYTASDFDLSAHEGDIRIDLQDIALPSSSLDILLTPHVLEHVPDTGRALREIYRVLVPAGRMYLQVPLLRGETIVPPEPEYHADHTLVFFNFGWDLTRTIRSAGFEVRVLVTEQFKTVLANRSIEPADTDPQFDIPSMWHSVETEDLEVVADIRASDLYGFSPCHHYVTWECIKSPGGR